MFEAQTPQPSNCTRTWFEFGSGMGTLIISMRRGALMTPARIVLKDVFGILPDRTASRPVLLLTCALVAFIRSRLPFPAQGATDRANCANARCHCAFGRAATIP